MSELHITKYINGKKKFVRSKELINTGLELPQKFVFIIRENDVG